MKQHRLALVAGCGLLAISTGAAAQREPPRERTRTLVSFPAAPKPLAEWMRRHRWETQRGNPRRFRIEGGALRLVSEKDSVAIGLRKGVRIRPGQWPRLRFRIRIDRLPRGTDLRRKSGDDAAFRLFLAFDRDDGWFHPPHTLAYAWTENIAKESVIQSAHFDNVRYLSVGRGMPPKGEDGVSRWLTIERDLAADYRRAFPETKAPVPAIVGILLKCDANNTRTRAASRLAWVKLVRPHEVDAKNRR